ncbi:pitrilysin family protein [Halobacteriovorax sp. HLS]|uniref:M16 family metallopeptidase n=1 Tax=Halobacteriovorax sp. HLS TaxID=2234000 RepID=UPI000FDAF820|nr:pitrilysin family protein [Halobacteriovorax sp. HLS]
MKNIIRNISLVALVITSVSVHGFGKDRIKKLNWNGIDVTWLEDSRFPTYKVMVHFSDGALSDHPKRRGETDMMFKMLDNGTRRFSQKDISDNLEFYGTSWGADVSHESTVYHVSGLIKDLSPSMKKICHLFKDAYYPKNEITKYKRLLSNSARSVVKNHSAIASKAFRELSLKGSPYDYPVDGKVSDRARISSVHLKRKLNYFNTEVKKKIYISGPKEILNLESIIINDCGWSGENSKYERVVNYTPLKPLLSPKIYLVTVPKANQAQVRMGRFLNQGEYEESELNALASEFLGGGFTSKLMREIRVKRGLSYTVSSFAGGQRQYGRSVISTFTKTSTIDELLHVIKNVLLEVKDKGIEPSELARAQGALAGSSPFRFESSSAYLKQLMYFDDINKNYDELYKFSDIVRSYKEPAVREKLVSLYNWSNQVIVVVGPKSLKKDLEQFGKVTKVPYKEFF